jgi:lipopolysaccharide transport system ATP-binding protein
VQLCSHAIMLDAGELILQGDPKLVTGQYQRLVNLSGDEAAKVRAEIRGLGAEAPSAEVAKSASGQSHSTGAKSDAQEAPADWLDASLKPQTTVSYEPVGGYLSNVRILSLDGREVNVLQANRVYRFVYTFTAHAQAQDVSFGMHFKTTQGLELCGANTDRNRSHRLSSVEEGETMEIEFRFTCLLRPGTYFANAGAMGTIGEHRKFLHRLLDATAFRVVSEQDDLDFGYFKLGVAASTRKLAGPAISSGVS